LVSDKQTRIRQLLRKLEVPLLAEIPKMHSLTGAKNINKTLQKGELDYGYSEAIRSLRTSIVMRSGELGSKSIAFTGVHDGDGKTTISISVAQAFSKLEKAILVDSDLRAPSIGRAIGLKKDRPGLSSFITRRANFSECLFRQPETGLKVLSSGPIPNDPMIHIATPRYAQLMKKLTQVYERVILDAPAVNSVSDILVISKSVGGVVIVCNIEKLDLDSLIEAVQTLRDNGVPIIGAVINKVKRVNSKGRKRHSKLTRVVNS
jgi:receptor protein-tyrosine kinase